MTKTTCRAAIASDALVISDMIAALFAHHGDEAEISPEQVVFLGFGPDPWARFLVAETEGRVVGYAGLVRKVQLQTARKIMDLTHLYVEPELRGQGIGGMLIQAAVERAQLEGCKVMTLGVDARNPRALNAYQRAGFEPYESSGWKMARAL